jgi:hypothetical protein
MYEWELVEPANDRQRGKVKLKRSYWIMPGMAFYFPRGAIHSHRTYDDSKLIRIEGMNIRSNRFRVGGEYFEPISTEVIHDGDLGGQSQPPDAYQWHDDCDTPTTDVAPPVRACKRIAGAHPFSLLAERGRTLRL